MRDEAPATRAPAPDLGAMLVLTQVSLDENQTFGINLALIGFPAHPMAGHAGPVLLGRKYALFLRNGTLLDLTKARIEVW
jgi:hypothetical protein